MKPNEMDENGVSSMSGTDQSLVLRAIHARGVVTLTLNRPAAFNALSEAMLAALRAELTALADEEAGAGENSLSRVLVNRRESGRGAIAGRRAHALSL